MFTVENREVRGWILRICQRASPHGASFELIENTLAEAGFHISLNEVKNLLVYLKEKEYIRLEEVEIDGIKRRINYITPHGVDLLEGNIEPDP